MRMCPAALLQAQMQGRRLACEAPLWTRVCSLSSVVTWVQNTLCRRCRGSLNNGLSFRLAAEPDVSGNIFVFLSFLVVAVDL